MSYNRFFCVIRVDKPFVCEKCATAIRGDVVMSVEDMSDLQNTGHLMQVVICRCGEAYKLSTNLAGFIDWSLIPKPRILRSIAPLLDESKN